MLNDDCNVPVLTYGYKVEFLLHLLPVEIIRQYQIHCIHALSFIDEQLNMQLWYSSERCNPPSSHSAGYGRTFLRLLDSAVPWLRAWLWDGPETIEASGLQQKMLESA
jgi:hypothetical protein